MSSVTASLCIPGMYDTQSGSCVLLWCPDHILPTPPRGKHYLLLTQMSKRQQPTQITTVAPIADGELS